MAGLCHRKPTLLVRNNIQPQIAELSTYLLEIKSSSKLDFSKVGDVAVFLSAKSLSPSRNIGAWSFPLDVPPQPSLRALLGLFQLPVQVVHPGLKSQGTGKVII